MRSELDGPVDPRVSIVVAKAANDVIGRDNAIPWHLPEDLRHFKNTTLGGTLIMGRRTFESIGRPLPGRRTIVVSRNRQWRAAGVEVAASLPDALQMTGASERVFVVGGAALFQEAMNIAGELIVTEVELKPDGDVRFPPISDELWRKIPGTPMSAANGIQYRISKYERRQIPAN